MILNAPAAILILAVRRVLRPGPWMDAPPVPMVRECIFVVMINFANGNEKAPRETPDGTNPNPVHPRS